MNSLIQHIRELARAIEAAGKYKLQDTRIYFSAPDPDSPTTETLDIKKKKEFEANFQWVAYAVKFTNEDMDWYIYQTQLHPWGTKMEGTQEVIASDSTSKWKLYRDEEVEIRPDKVERAFSSMLRKPDLHPRTQVTYVNTHKSDKGDEYSSEEFKRKFDNDFYVVVSKGRELVNPFGTEIGVKGKPEEEK